MSNNDILTRLAMDGERVKSACAEYNAALVARDEAMMAAHNAGVPHSVIARTAAVSPALVTRRLTQVLVSANDSLRKLPISTMAWNSVCRFLGVHSDANPAEVRNALLADPKWFLISKQEGVGKGAMAELFAWLGDAK